jgi:gas vesicle protein
MIYEDDELLEDATFSAGDGRDGATSSGNVALAVLAGAAIGAAVALLFAPKTGTDMRRAVRKRADTLRNTAGVMLDETADDVSKELRRRGRQLRRKLEAMA